MLREGLVLLFVICSVIIGHEVARLTLSPPFRKDVPIDHYEALGVKRTDTIPIIKKAFKSAALQYHPDKNADSDVYARLTQAYAVLSDPIQRAKYDESTPDVVRLEEGKGITAEVSARHTRLFEFQPKWWTLDAFDVNVFALTNGRVQVAVFPGDCVEVNQRQPSKGKSDVLSDGRRHVVHVSLREKSWEPCCIQVQGANMLYPTSFEIGVETGFDISTWIGLIGTVYACLRAWQLSGFLIFQLAGYLSVVWIVAMVIIPHGLHCSCNIGRVCYGADLHPFLIVTALIGTVYLLWSIRKAYQYPLRIFVTAAICFAGTIILWRYTPSIWWPRADALAFADHPWVSEGLYCGVAHSVALLDRWGFLRYLDSRLPQWVTQRVVGGTYSMLSLLGGGVTRNSIVNSWELHLGVFGVLFALQLWWSQREPQQGQHQFRGAGRRLGGSKHRKKLVEKEE